MGKVVKSQDVSNESQSILANALAHARVMLRHHESSSHHNYRQLATSHAWKLTVAIDDPNEVLCERRIQEPCKVFNVLWPGNAADPPASNKNPFVVIRTEKVEIVTADQLTLGLKMYSSLNA